jgi:hypothetical protein
LLGVDQPWNVDIGTEFVVGEQTGHLCVDELGAPLTGEGEPMMPVLDEIDAADLEERDGGPRP